MNKHADNKRWDLLDWIFFILTIISPVVSLLCALLIENPKYSENEKLATIVAGITIPTILIGWRQNENKGLIKSVKGLMAELESTISPTRHLAKILSSGDEKRVSFTQRRLGDFKTILRRAAQDSETELLSVPIYYSELNNLADTIQNDNNPDKCEIWAMTSFTDEEWGDRVNDLEVEWGKRIRQLSGIIVTKRICIIDSELAQLLKKRKDYYSKQKQDWVRNSSNPVLIQQRRLKSFFDYLITYYKYTTDGLVGLEPKVKNYALKSTDQGYIKLIQEKGFFGIKSSDGNKCIITGEDVTSNGIQGRFVFSEDRINELYDFHIKACKKDNTLESFLLSDKTSSDFKEFIRVELGDKNKKSQSGK